MHRFRMIRMWILLLTMLLGVTGSSVVARADSGSGWQGDESGDIVTPDNPPPTGAGDPDSPSNGGKPTTRPSVRGGRVGVFVQRGSGEAASNAASAWELRVRLLVHAMKAYYLRW